MNKKLMEKCYKINHIEVFGELQPEPATLRFFPSQSGLHIEEETDKKQLRVGINEASKMCSSNM